MRQMKILGIESSAHVASAAVIEDEVLRAEFTINNGMTHSETLMPMLADMLRLSGTDKESLDAIAVSAGPGSFTGLRIGAATAKGLALGLDLPIISVSTLESLAFNLCNAEGAVVCPIMDARRGQVYRAAFQNGIRVLQDGAGSMDELIDWLNERLSGNGEVIFLGDGVPVYRKLISERLEGSYVFATAENCLQRAASTAQLGMWAYRRWLIENELTPEKVRSAGTEGIDCFDEHVMSPDDFVPVYIRKPQAQRELEAGLLEDPGMHSLKKLRGEKRDRRHDAEKT